MESVEETNQVEDKNDENKNKDNSLKENGIQEPLPKKKFANTNFALKMKNKRKLHDLDAKEALSSCKEVSIDVTRLNSNPVHKVVNAIEGKNRKRKKSQWKLGIMKKKKKVLGKNPLNKQIVNGVSDHINEIVEAAESVEVKKEESILPNSEKKKRLSAAGSKSSERRKSLRSVTSSTSETSFCESKVDLESEDTNYSCRRTEPFIGKLITKEARDEIANRILRGETELKADSSDQASGKDVTPDNKESETKAVNKSLPDTATNAETSDKTVKKAEKSIEPTMMETKKSIEPTLMETKKSIEPSMMETDEKEVAQPSTSKVTEAKENAEIEEICCSRTMPFKGKTIRKLPAGVPERPIEIDSSTNQSDEQSLPKDDTVHLMECSTADKSELFDSPKDINANAESTLEIKILSVSSLKDDEGVKDDFIPEKVDESASQPSATPLKDANVDSDSPHKVNMDSDASVKKRKGKLRLSRSTKLDAPMKTAEEQSDSLSEKTDASKETKNVRSTRGRLSLRSNSSMKSDSLSEDLDSKSTTPTSEDVENPWSCQRILPYQGRKSSSIDKQLAAVNAPNQPEASSSAPNVSSVSPKDPVAPSEPSADRLISTDDNQIKVNAQIDENTSQNKIEKNAKSKDCAKSKNCEKVESLSEPSNGLDARSMSGSPVLNGEWKFRRKRRILSSDEDTQDKETKKTKKSKVKSLSDTKADIEKQSVTPLPSPGKTICSFLSTKCTKHDHHSENGQGSAPDDVVKPEAYVLLTRLEDMKDPEVKGYLQKTDSVDTVKKNYRRIVTNKVAGDTTRPDRERSISTSTQATKDESVPLSQPETAQESDSTFKPSQETEDSSSQSTATTASRRRMSSRASSESPILSNKRKKRPVNYLEEFSDSDEDNVSSSGRLRSKQLNRGPMRRDRTKSGGPGASEMDENDMEVEEFSRVGRQNRAEGSGLEDSEQDANDSRTESVKATDEFKKARARCKSVAERKLSETQRYPTRAKTPHVGMSTEPPTRTEKTDKLDPEKLQEDVLQGMKSLDEEIQKELDKSQKKRPRSTGLGTSKKTTSDVSAERLPATPSVPASKPMTPKKILGTPAHVDAASPRSSRSTTPRRSVTFQRNEQLTKVTKSASELMEADRKKEAELKDVRVQLIKLEAVCSDYKDYSAAEIELLTNKYIDMLMNSNFACDTWRNPIKLATSYSRTVDLRGDDEGDSDYDSQDNEPLPFETVQVPMDSAEVDFDATTEPSVNQSPRHKSPKNSSKQPNELDSAIATLSQNANSQEKTFGAINISEVLSQPAANEEDVENNRTMDSNAEEETNDNDDSVGPLKDSGTILVNGTEMHTCASCNKIFVEKELLQKHVAEDHKDGKKSSASTTVSSKTSVKKAPGPASSKKIKPKKFRYNENLTCSVCNKFCETKELLFDHIMKHGENDLQEAYKVAKLRQTGDTTASEELADEQAKKQKKKSNHRISTDSASTIASGEELAVAMIASTSQQAAISNALTTVQSGTSNKTFTVCQCHAHELASQDLHIEMVLLCTGCNVIYRRRDCFEVHFRTNAECRMKRSNGVATKVPKLFCSGCRCILNSLMEMRSHLEVHAENNGAGTVTFLCNICKVAFFGVGGIFYSHWFNHAKSPNFVASRYSFPKLSVVSVLEDPNGTMTTSKSQEGFFYIAEHVCRECRLPFSSDPELQKHKQQPCQTPQPVVPRVEPIDNNRLQMIKLICDLCKKYYVSKENFDKHCNDRNHLKTPITKFSRLPINATDQVFVCSLCRGPSNTLDEMKEHWKRVHSPIMELYTCKTCNVVPSNDVANYTYDKFEHHCRLVHKSEVITCLVYFVTARYVCNICKFGFETEKSMKEHELMHQKTVPVSTAPPLMGEPQTATFFLANNPQPDGGRQLQPVVMQYPSINGNIVGPVAMVPIQMPVTVNAPATVASNQLVLPSTNGLGVPLIAVNQDVNNELRKALSGALQGQQHPQGVALSQPPQQQQPKPSKIVETIELDSRSNSPVLDSPAASSSSSSTSSAAAKKAYMTKVNPHFESILKTTAGKASNSGDDTPNADKSRPNRDENATPAEVDTLTPQPFEVVLVTDELSENSNQDKGGDSLGGAPNEEPQQQPQPEIIETKSFLRVRSVAELQSIKIHLCSVCGLNFDTPYAFEQHEKQHHPEVGRSTPVQMISPMVAPANRPPNNDAPHSFLVTQMKQKLALNMANRQPPPTASTNVNTRVMPSVLPHQPVLPPQQQSSWYPTTSNTTSTMSSVSYATNTSMQAPQQHGLLRQAINSGQARSSYSTVRAPPPPYPSTSNSMVAPGRPSAIQLPERSTTGNVPPQTKRPSGAATRIPQQSLPSFDDLNNRQTGGTVTYNASPSQQQPVTHKTYGPAPGSAAANYSSVNSPVNYQSVPQQQPRQQQPQKNTIYTCKHPNCFYRSASLAGIRAHETIHMLSQQGQPPQQMPTTSNHHQQQMQQQQQQQQQLQRLPVSQMPERTRHALPTSRPPGMSNVPDKRITCRICNKNCATSIELIEHVSTAHSSANQVCCYVCDYCPSPLIFDTEDQLRKHMNQCHNHSCEICNKRYPSKEDLMVHTEVHMRRP